MKKGPFLTSCKKWKISNEVWNHNQLSGKLCCLFSGRFKCTTTYTCHTKMMLPVSQGWLYVSFDVKANNVLMWFREKHGHRWPWNIWTAVEWFAVYCTNLKIFLSFSAQWDAINEMDEYFSPIHTYQVCNLSWMNVLNVLHNSCGFDKVFLST